MRLRPAGMRVQRTIVVAEIAVLPLAFGAWQVALLFSLANGLLLWWRIRVENEALRLRREPLGTVAGQS